MPYPLIAAGVGALGSALGGWLGGRKKARTSSFDRTSATSGTTTRTRTLRPEQEESMGWLRDIMEKLLTDPSAGLEPLKIGARGAVNRRYAGAPQSLADRMLGHGQKSGKFGTAMRQIELSRLGELSDLEPEFARMILEQQEKGVGIAQRLLSEDFGGTVTTSGTDRSYGTGVAPGSATGGAFSTGGAAMGQIATLMMLNQMLQGANRSTAAPALQEHGLYGGG